MKLRIYKESNYKAIFTSGKKTYRFQIDSTKPITELEYPEFYDIKITDKCRGNCPYCYMDSAPNKEHYRDVVKKIQDFFGSMTPNQRPFQVAIGGGEPTEAPYFGDVLKVFHELGIVPNYTTNGMFVGTDLRCKIRKLTEMYCGGVALSCHPHLQKYWERAIWLFHERGIILNLHIIISDKQSVDSFIHIHDKWHDVVDYFVLLPYVAQGRAKQKNIDWSYLRQNLLRLADMKKIAFGAHFYPYLKMEPERFKISLYEPEIFSKFLDLKDMKLYPSSFDL